MCPPYGASVPCLVKRESMKAEEPTFVYQSQQTATRLRGQIIKSVESEDNMRVLQHLYVVIEQMKKNEERKVSSKGLSSLQGVLRTDKETKTYKEMRDEYMLEKYGL